LSTCEAGSDVEARALLRARPYLHLDTANGYTRGRSEKIVGDYQMRTGQRERAVLATRFFLFANMYADNLNGGGAGCKSLMRACPRRCGGCRPITSI